ncbi:homoprotocatechuate degradation operon regulator HpaR [Wohlfahrtiimonas chitiniclastica]|uniref:homoprotocatechuate degradation operon regulator HpaR n=1 Tax=Wohlfahrtiimonas chitiniclastica TaxID=400946 RepID=UPI001BCD6025|nr:homoprotocatechuate degradation operon regulator HpaR [Wohlfahrtiimonas chitiniclastica]MBS7838431.1 homoprotocatechuate degradation operon regulator HpaR [Wohlfahrtiimonas chitiniclastica]
MKPRNRNIPLLLLQAREAMMAYFRPALSKYQLTEQQWRILRALNEKEELEPHELCQECCILSPSMAGILKRMSELDLIVKVPSTLDKRRVMVRLAPGIDQMVEDILEENRAAYDELVRKVGEEEMRDLVSRVDSMLKRLQS